MPPSEVRIIESLVTKRFSTLAPSPGTNLNAGDIQFFVEGTDVGTQRAVDFGHTHTVKGHFYAPNGTIGLKRQSTFTGIFVAKDIMIGHDAVVELDPGTGQPIVSAPVISPNGGSFFNSVEVNLSTIISGATIHYTIDGTDPTTASPVFTAPFTLTTSALPQTVKAIAVRDGFIDSNITSADFNVQPQTVAPVVISPPSGTFQDFVFLTMSTATEGAQIFYTTDGSDPTSTSIPYQFAVGLDQSATVRAIAIKAGLVNSPITGETYTIQSSPPGTNQVVGRLLDTNSLVNEGLEIPVVGATISLLNTTITAVSDADGKFTLDNVPLGDQILDINTSTANLAPDGSTYAGFREKIEILSGVTVVSRPFFMPRIDAASLTTVDPLVDTLVVNPNLGASLFVAAGTALDENGNLFTGELSISEVPGSLAPAALPEFLEPGLLVTIQPVGVTFSTPAPLTLPNVNQFPVNAENEYNIWSLDPGSGTFIIVGTGKVSADGSQLETISGGVRATDWHFTEPTSSSPSQGSGTAGKNEDTSKEQDCECGSDNSIKSGELTATHDLVSYRSFGQSRGLRMIYRSLSADPRPIVSVDATNPRQNAIPLTVSTTLELNGQSQGSEVFIDTSSFGEFADEDFRLARQLDATNLSTGRYLYRMKITSNYLRSSISSFSEGNVLVNNEQDSPYGAGWTLAGVQKLHIQQDGGALITDGTGGSQLFGPLNNFTPSLISTNTGSNLSEISTADLNGDGFLDVLALGADTLNDAFIFLGDGTGNFSNLNNIDVTGFFSSLIVADIDGDGFQDFAAILNEDVGGGGDTVGVSGTGDIISIFFGDGTGAFPTQVDIQLTTSASSLAVADVNNDGSQDLVLGQTNQLEVMFGDGARNFSGSAVTPVSGTIAAIVQGRFDANNFQDFVVATTAGTGELKLLNGDGLGNFLVRDINNGSLEVTERIKSGDFNADGFTDLVVGSPNSAEVGMFINDTQGGFLAPEILSTGGSFSSLAIGDFGNDGILDLGFTLNLLGAVSVLKGDGPGQLFPPVTTEVANMAPGNATVGDFNNDGLLDFVFVNSIPGSADQVATLLGSNSAGGLFVSPPGDFSKLEQNPDNTFTRTMKDGTQHHFDANSLHTSTVDRNGNTTTYTYDANDNLTSITDPANLVTTFTYDANGKLDTITDPANRVTDFDIDANGDLI